MSADTDPKGAAPAPAAAPRAPSEQGTGSNDGPLDSLGKAIAAPVEGAAEDEEPPAGPGQPAPARPG